jgi:hypothetical protein
MTATTKAKNVVSADPIAAVERLVERLDARLSGNPPQRLAVDDLLDDLKSQIGDRAAVIMTAAKAIASRYDADVQRLGATEIGRNMCRGQLANLIAIADEQYAPSSDELTDAELALAEAEEAYGQGVADLEDAVLNGDVDKILRLRAETEVVLPRAREQAELAALKQRIKRAEEARVGPASRHEAALAAKNTAAEAVADAEAVVAAAREAAETAAWAADRSEQVLSHHKQRLSILARSYEQLTHDVELEVEKRLRRLAGLSEPEPEPESKQDRKTQMIEPSPVRVTYKPGKNDKPTPIVRQGESKILRGLDPVRGLPADVIGVR